MKSSLDYWSKEDADDCLKAIGVELDQSVLDFGCALGSYSIPAARIVGKWGRVYALDKNAEALETLERLAFAQGLQHIHAINTHGVVHIPLKDESVDVVLLHDVLHLIGWEENQGQTIRRSTVTDRKSLLDEVFRVMRWNSVLSVFSPHLVTHTDITSNHDMNREIESAGFRLEREMYHQLVHDGDLQQAHLYSFRKRPKSEPVLESFIYDSPSFQTQLKQDAHQRGEVTILEAMAEPGMIALELGANKGVISVALARSVGLHGEIHAFEPVPEYYNSLSENLHLNKIQNVRIHQLAVTDKENEIRYYKHGEGSGIVPAEDTEDIFVGTTSLDNFMAVEALERVDLINMDCEGSELLVFQGGKKTLQQNEPHIFCEIHHDRLSRLGHSAHEVVEYLHALGFQVKPVSVEALDEDVDLESCTHIYAGMNGNPPDIKWSGRQQQGVVLTSYDK